MIIPLKDNVPTHKVPIITVSLIVVNIFIFVWISLFLKSMEKEIVRNYAFVPKEFLIAFTSRPDLMPYNVLTIFTSMFLHGGIFHVLGNMLYLWIFGNNIEDTIGKGRFVVFYLLSGLVAALSQYSTDPASQMPMIGASGAVSGVLGAYLVMYPYAKIKTLLFLFVFFTTTEIPAVLLLTIWFLIQVVFAYGPGVAWFAHIGGFVFGMITIYIFAIGRTINRSRTA